MFEKKPLVATTVSIWNMHDKIHNQVNCLNRLARSEVNAGHGAMDGGSEGIFAWHLSPPGRLQINKPRGLYIMTSTYHWR